MTIFTNLFAVVAPSDWDAARLRKWLEATGISQLELGRRLAVEGRSVRRFVSGESEIPGPVRAALDSWVQLENLRRTLD